MPAKYNRDAALPLRVPPVVREALDKVRKLAPARVPVTRNAAGVAALILGTAVLERALRSDPNAVSRVLAGEKVDARSPAQRRTACDPRKVPAVRVVLAGTPLRLVGRTCGQCGQVSPYDQFHIKHHTRPGSYEVCPWSGAFPRGQVLGRGVFLPGKRNSRTARAA